MRNKPAFTLVELLVVVAIIVALLAILVPSMRQAVIAGRRVACLSNAHQQYLTQLNYASDNFGMFVGNVSTAPDWQRWSNAANSPVSKLRGSYLVDTRIMLCPILGDIPRQQGVGVFQRNDWTTLNTYGGWDTHMPNINSGYMWMAAFQPIQSLQMIDGEPAPPRRVSESSASHTLITHRLSFFLTDALHELVHFGRGYWQDGVTGVPYDGHQSTEQPLTRGDGSTLVRSRGEIKPRMTLGGNYPASPGNPGTFLW